MKQTFKYFWAHRKQNGFVLVEIALVAFLSFYFLDFIVICFYDTHLCAPAGDFEKEHLLVAYAGKTGDETDVDSETDSQKIFQMWESGLVSMRDSVRALPEVQSASLINSLGRFSGASISTFSPEADTARCCHAYVMDFPPYEQFMETLGLTATEGSPSVEELSENCPENGAVISRSTALALFGTDQVVGRRMVEQVHKWDVNTTELEGPYVIAGVVEDFRINSNDRYAYSILIPNTKVGNIRRLLIRLRPDADAEAFIEKYESNQIQVGNHVLYQIQTYFEYTDTPSNGIGMINNLLATFIVLLLLNVMLGTLGTFWLQIRKRTEDIGIMRSFGAKRQNIFGMLWKEAALLTLIACIIGQILWWQFAQSIGVARGDTSSGTHMETDWTNVFWQHYLVICVIQYLILLLIVTIGMVVPTFLAMYKRPVEALHHE